MKTIFLTILSSCYSTLVLAQESEKKDHVNFDALNNAWYNSPWVWVFVAALFILFLVILSRGKKD